MGLTHKLSPSKSKLLPFIAGSQLNLILARLKEFQSFLRELFKIIYLKVLVLADANSLFERLKKSNNQFAQNY